MGNTIKGLLPDGRLPSAAEAHVRSLIDDYGADLAVEVSGTVALDPEGPRILEFYTTGVATIGGEVFPVDTALVVRRKVDGSWERWVAGVDSTWVVFDVGGGSESPEEPTDAPPIPGTLTASDVAATKLTLTASGFSAAAGMPNTPFSFSTDGGATWSTWQSSPKHTATLLTPDTDHICQHRIRDTEGQIVGGTPVTVRTLFLAELWADAIAADAPTHWWKLDEAAGSTAVTDSGSSPATAVIVGSPVFGGASLGGSAHSVQFSAGSYVDTGAMDFTPLKSATVEVLASAAGDSSVAARWWEASGFSRGELIGGGPGPVQATGKMSIPVAGGVATTQQAPAVALPPIVHFVATIAATGEIKTYMNGELVHTSTRTDPNAPFSGTSGAIKIGSIATAGGAILSDVVVYNNKVLTEARVKTHARAAGVYV